MLLDCTQYEDSGGFYELGRCDRLWTPVRQRGHGGFGELSLYFILWTFTPLLLYAAIRESDATPHGGGDTFPSPRGSSLGCSVEWAGSFGWRTFCASTR